MAGTDGAGGVAGAIGWAGAGRRGMDFLVAEAVAVVRLTGAVLLAVRFLAAGFFLAGVFFVGLRAVARFDVAVLRLADAPVVLRDRTDLVLVRAAEAERDREVVLLEALFFFAEAERLVFMIWSSYQDDDFR